MTIDVDAGCYDKLESLIYGFFLKMAGPEKTVGAQLEALRASIQGGKDSEQPYEVK